MKKIKMAALSAAVLAALASLSFADTPGAKTYRISVANAAGLRGNQLAPGEYTLAVDTASVRMVELRTGKTFEVPAKVGTSEKKFAGNAITTQKVDGKIEIVEICLGATKIQVDFH